MSKEKKLKALRAERESLVTELEAVVVCSCHGDS